MPYPCFLSSSPAPPPPLSAVLADALDIGQVHLQVDAQALASEARAQSPCDARVVASFARVVTANDAAAKAFGRLGTTSPSPLTWEGITRCLSVREGSRLLVSGDSTPPPPSPSSHSPTPFPLSLPPLIPNSKLPSSLPLHVLNQVMLALSPLPLPFPLTPSLSPGLVTRRPQLPHAHASGLGERPPPPFSHPHSLPLPLLPSPSHHHLCATAGCAWSSRQ